MLMIKERSNHLKVKIIRDKVSGYTPSDYKIKKWARNSYMLNNNLIVIIKIATEKNMRDIKRKFFNNDNICNVLSFPYEVSKTSLSNNLGDIIMCASIINRESQSFHQRSDDRWAHMITHSMLHLQGYTHDERKKRGIMEKKEIKLMNKLGFSNPYYAK